MDAKLHEDHPGVNARDCVHSIPVDCGGRSGVTMSGYACGITGGHCKGLSCKLVERLDK